MKMHHIKVHFSCDPPTIQPYSWAGDRSEQYLFFPLQTATILMEVIHGLCCVTVSITHAHHFPINYWCQLQKKDLLTLTDSLCYFSCIQVLLKHAGPCWVHMQRSTLWRKLWRKGVEVKVRHSANTALCYVCAAIFSCLTVKINFSMVTFGKYKKLWVYCVE